MRPDWLPEYDETLCFLIKVNMPMAVIIRLKTSMYEGMCMNAAVPEADDQINDIVPYQVYGCIEMSGQNGTFIAMEYMNPREPKCLYVRVLDFAAEAGLEAWKSDDRSVHAEVEIPRDFDRFKSNADPDSDGFTNWEEYRGFMIYDGNERTDSTNANVFVCLHCADIDWSRLLISAHVAGIPQGYNFISGTQGLVSDGRFLDYKSQYRDKWGVWLSNSLCYPGYTTPSSPSSHQACIHEAILELGLDREDKFLLSLWVCDLNPILRI